MTHDQIYEKLLGLEESLINIRSGLIRMEALPLQLKDHEERLRELEAYYNRAKGALAVSAIGGGIVSGAVVAAIQLLIG